MNTFVVAAVRQPARAREFYLNRVKKLTEAQLEQYAFEAFPEQTAGELMETPEDIRDLMAQGVDIMFEADRRDVEWRTVRDRKFIFTGGYSDIGAGFFPTDAYPPLVLLDVSGLTQLRHDPPLEAKKEAVLVDGVEVTEDEAVVAALQVRVDKAFAQPDEGIDVEAVIAIAEEGLALEIEDDEEAKLLQAKVRTELDRLRDILTDAANE